MGDLHVMRFDMWVRCTKAGPEPLDIWELCTIDEAEQRLTDQDKPKKAVKMTLIVHKVITRTQKEAKSYPHFLCIKQGFGIWERCTIICGYAARCKKRPKLTCGYVARSENCIWGDCTYDLRHVGILHEHQI